MERFLQAIPPESVLLTVALGVQILGRFAERGGDSLGQFGVLAVALDPERPGESEQLSAGQLREAGRVAHVDLIASRCVVVLAIGRLGGLFGGGRDGNGPGVRGGGARSERADPCGGRGSGRHDGCLVHQRTQRLAGQRAVTQHLLDDGVRLGLVCRGGQARGGLINVAHAFDLPGRPAVRAVLVVDAESFGVGEQVQFPLGNGRGRLPVNAGAELDAVHAQGGHGGEGVGVGGLVTDQFHAGIVCRFAG